MTIIALLGLVILAPIILFLGWFRRLSTGWLGIWFGLGGLACAICLYIGFTAPSMDWGYSLGIASLWTVFWGLGGLIQVFRLLKQRGEG